MRDDIRLAKITIKPRFENANFKFYRVFIPKAAKMKRIPHVKTARRQERQTRLGGEL